MMKCAEKNLSEFMECRRAVKFIVRHFLVHELKGEVEILENFKEISWVSIRRSTGAKAEQYGAFIYIVLTIC